MAILTGQINFIRCNSTSFLSSPKRFYSIDLITTIPFHFILIYSSNYTVWVVSVVRRIIRLIINGLFCSGINMQWDILFCVIVMTQFTHFIGVPSQRWSDLILFRYSLFFRTVSLLWLELREEGMKILLPPSWKEEPM